VGKKSDWSELEAFAESFARLGDQVDDLLESVAKELAARMLAKVKKLTPVGQYPKGSGKKGGTLRRRWTAEVQRDGKTYVVEVVNPVEYASYVEYGHRTRDHKGWVNGKYMMTISEQELRGQTPALLERMLAQWLRGGFDGK